METCRDTIVSSDMPKRKKIIYLVGFMGSGKTTVGALLAEQLGGGTIIQPENRKLIREAQGTTIWLETSLEVLRSRCAGMNHRPLVRDPDSLGRLFRERLPEYQKSEFRVATDLLGAQQVVENVLRLPIF